ncbi:hypothetical protein [Priestia megaterium]|uniref:hypothetical protein n=1 Tax=Priestia megaterium TaxID=1404 RepID=UPI002FFDC577
MDLSDSIGLAFFTIIFTLLANVIFKWLQNKFDFLVEVKKFKREHYYNQLSELYMELYAVIAQSEFLRVFHNIDSFGSLKDIPFLEIQQKLKKHQKDLFSGEDVKSEIEIVENTITKFNKIGLVESILTKKQFASQDLLKLAVAYRYCHEHYLNENLEAGQLEKFQKTELELIYKIVVTVIKECNSNLKFCKMDYNKLELREGKMDNKIFNFQKVI